MLGIIISIATIFILVSLSLGLQGAIKEQFEILGSDKIFIQPRGQFGGPGTEAGAKLTLEDVDVVKKVRGVGDYSYYAAGSAKLEYGGQTRYFFVSGIPLDSVDLYIETGAFEADEGKLLEEGDREELMIGSYYKYKNLFKDPVRVGDKLLVNEREFKVKGIIEPIGNPGDDQNVLMSYEDFQDLFNSSDRVDAILVEVAPGEDVREVSKRLEKDLKKSRGVTDKTIDFTISTPEELLESFQAILNIIVGFLVGVAGISLIVGAIGITNTMYTSVLERTREIGVMKAIGAKNQDIMIIFLIESGLLGLVGGIVGVLVGFGFSKIVEFTAIQSLGTDLFRAASPWYLVIGCLVFAFITGAVSGTLPALQASKINTAEALRHE